MILTTYWEQKGSHVHMNVFVNHAKCGELCMRVTEFLEFKIQSIIPFVFVEMKDGKTVYPNE